MKTAISIPDEVFETAEELANRLGKSRSQLYTQAISGYIKKYRQVNVTEMLDKIYSNIDSSLEPPLRKLQSRSLLKDEW